MSRYPRLHQSREQTNHNDRSIYHKNERSNSQCCPLCVLTAQPARVTHLTHGRSVALRGCSLYANGLSHAFLAEY